MDEREWPATAEALMRSRFAAFRVGDAELLLTCWHPTTRPAAIDLTDNPRWRGLQIVDVVDGGADDETGVVEFRATYLTARSDAARSDAARSDAARIDAGSGVVGPGEVLVLHERSRFVRADGRWYYLDGEQQTGIGG